MEERIPIHSHRDMEEPLIFNLYDYFLGNMLLHGTGIGNYQTAEGREEGI